MKGGNKAHWGIEKGKHIEYGENRANWAHVKSKAHWSMEDTYRAHWGMSKQSTTSAEIWGKQSTQRHVEGEGVGVIEVWRNKAHSDKRKQNTVRWVVAQNIFKYGQNKPHWAVGKTRHVELWEQQGTLSYRLNTVKNGQNKAHWVIGKTQSSMGKTWHTGL